MGYSIILSSYIIVAVAGAARRLRPCADRRLAMPERALGLVTVARSACAGSNTRLGSAACARVDAGTCLSTPQSCDGRPQRMRRQQQTPPRGCLRRVLGVRLGGPALPGVQLQFPDGAHRGRLRARHHPDCGLLPDLRAADLRRAPARSLTTGRGAGGAPARAVTVLKARPAAVLRRRRAAHGFRVGLGPNKGNPRAGFFYNYLLDRNGTVFCARNVLARMGVTTVYMAIITLIACLIPFFGCGRGRARARSRAPRPRPPGAGRGGRAAWRPRQSRRWAALVPHCALQAGSDGRPGAAGHACAVGSMQLPSSCSKRPWQPRQGPQHVLCAGSMVQASQAASDALTDGQSMRYCITHSGYRKAKDVRGPEQVSAPCEVLVERWPGALC